MTGPVVICCVGGPPKAPLGQYLLSYSPEAYQGRGWAEWTKDLTKARQFPDHTAAFEFWRQRSKVRPTRPDGRPNRPLTAFTITVEPL